MNREEALAFIGSIGLALGRKHPEPRVSKKVAPARLQRTREQVEELKRLAQEKRDRKAAKLRGEND
jgi:hypothetical protein